MKKLFAALLLPAIGAAPLALGLIVSACDTEDPTSAVIDNEYPAVDPDGGDPSQQTVVYKVWWSSSLFLSPIPSAAESDPSRVVTGGDVAYVILAPGWDPASTYPPTTLIPVKTRNSLFVKRGDTLHIHVSDTTVIGNCSARTSGQLTQDDADFITQRIFPGDFATGTYNAKSCALTLFPPEAGADADAGAADSTPGTGDSGTDSGHD